MKTLFSALATACLMVMITTTALAQWGGIRGEGPKVKKTLQVNDFDGIGLSFNATVYLRQGNRHSVEVEGQENIIDNIETDVKNGIWKIEFDENVRRHEGVTLWITMPTLTEASISGSGTIAGETPFKNLGDVKVGISGSGDIRLNLDARDIDTNISGSGDIELAGTAQNHQIRISGSGDISAYDLRTRNCRVRISGSGDCSVYAEEDLDISTSGSGDVYYAGRPRVKAKISGSGEVEPRG